MLAIEELHPVEVSALVIHEQTIAKGLETFYAVGNALLAIRDQRLYRALYDTFEGYCRDRWGIARRRAYQLMEAAEVVANVQNFAHALPVNESQARELAALPPELQGIAWGDVLATAPDGRVTAAHVAEVVGRYQDDPPLVEYIQEDPQPDRLGVLFSSASPEWYTPARVIAAVVGFFDQIDLDPCAEESDPKTVPASQHFTAADDGLSRQWWGRVYMNPPYGDEIGPWVVKLDAHYRAGDIEAGIALVPARTDTVWFDTLTPYAICFIRGRLKFGGPNYKGDGAAFPSALVYLGDEIDRFTEAVAHLGKVFTQRGTEES